MIEARRRIYTRRPARRRTDERPEEILGRLQREALLGRRLVVLATLAVLLALLVGCASTPDSHNPAGGYREACGELPGLLGDDC